MNKYTNSNISLEEWIRLNNVTDQVIIDAANTIIEQEAELKEAYDKIDNLQSVVDSMDVKSIEHVLDILLNDSDVWVKHINTIQTVLDNFKQRRKQV